MDLKDRIKEARGTLSQKAFEEIVGVGQPTISKWENGSQTPSAFYAKKIARLTSKHWTYYVDEEADGVQELSPETLDYTALKVANMRPGMGGPAEAIDDSEVLEYVPNRLITSLKAKPSDLWVMEVDGPSMSPALESGDYVIVDASKTNPSQPGIFVVWDGFGMVCKWVERVAKSDPPSIRLKSQNPLFEPYELTIGERGEAESYVMGRVVWISRKL